MRKLLKLIANRIGMNFTDVANWLREQNSLPEIEARILRADYLTAVRNVDAASGMIATEIQESYVTVARAEAKWLDDRITDKLIHFDTLDPAILRRAKANELRLVYGFQEERHQIAQQVTQRAMIEGARDGISPRRIAQDFRDSIGLTPQQEEWVANHRRDLEAGNYLAATRRELSSGHADRTLRAAARDGRVLTPAQIDSQVEQYRSNALTYRAQMIARTESLANAHDASDDALRQAIDRGNIDAEELECEWHAGPETQNARDDHQQMDGVKVPFGADFVLSDGTRMSGPGDRRGGAKHNAGCRCAKSVAFAA